MVWLKRLIKSKIFWASVVGIFGIIGTMVAGEQTVMLGLGEIFGLILIIFFRDTVYTSTNKK